MACALEPYLRVYTADINPRFILEFLLFDEEFPRSIRFSHRAHRGASDPARPPRRGAGRSRRRCAWPARLERPAEVRRHGRVEATGAGALLAAVAGECVGIHEAIYETFVAYPLEQRLPA